MIFGPLVRTISEPCRCCAHGSRPSAAILGIGNMRGPVSPCLHIRTHARQLCNVRVRTVLQGVHGCASHWPRTARFS